MSQQLTARKAISTTVDIESFNQIKETSVNCNVSIAEILRIIIKNHMYALQNNELKKDDELEDLELIDLDDDNEFDEHQLNQDNLNRLQTIATKNNDDINDLVNKLITDYIELNEDTPESKRKAFKAVYDNLGHGRGFVRIHKIRDRLNWNNKDFEKVLKSLISDLTIELHGGDPSTMTAKEIEGSYIDPKTGFLFITLTWWGNLSN